MISCRKRVESMHLGKVIFIATAITVIAGLAAAQTGGSSSGGLATIEPSKTPRVIAASKGPEAAVAEYKKVRAETLKKMVKLASVPPATAARVVSDCESYSIVIQNSLGVIEKIYTVPVHARAGEVVAMTAEQKRYMQYVQQERKQWEEFTKATIVAAEYQRGLKAKQAALQKAIEDAPQQIKALVDELKVVEERIKGYLKGAGRGADEQKRARRAITTLTGNVQHAWANIIKAGQDIFGKKEYKPETSKKRMEEIIRTLPHEVGHISNDDRQPFSQAGGDMAKQMKKSQATYAEVYAKAQKARKPLVSGAAAQAVPTFKGVKPDGLEARAKQQIQ